MGTRALHDRFWSKVDKSGECWTWKGAHGPSGHGQFRIEGKYGKCRGAHRVAWLLTYGVLPPDNMEVMHACDNPACVRPDHLSLGTHRENMADMVSKGRQAVSGAAVQRGDLHWTHRHPELVRRGDRHHARQNPSCMARGERAGTSKLTAEQVNEMRRRYAAGGISFRAIGAEYGVVASTACSIVQVRTWRHVCSEPGQT